MELNTPITSLLTRTSEMQKKALKKLGILTVFDIIYHFPSRYGDISEMKNIGSLVTGEDAVIFGRITKLKTSKAYKKNIPMADGVIEDDTGTIKGIWFNQPYIAKMIPEGALVRVEGKVSRRRTNTEQTQIKNGNDLYFSNPKIEKVTKIPTGVGNSLFGEETKDEHTMHPIYPESKGITSNWLHHAIIKVLKGGVLDRFVDPIPEELLHKYNLPTLKTALLWIHSPKSKNDALVARKRFAFEEVFYIQLDRQKARLEYQKNPSFKIDVETKHVEEFVSRFPFKITNSQENSINSILEDFKKDFAMSRLLEGDVGSGKTAVAATTAFSVVTTRPKNQDHGNLQVAYMVPTEILAKQQFENFIKYFSYLGINVGLITGDKCRKFPSKINPKGWTDISKAQLLKWVANGEIPILIGTHSLIQKTVKFKHLAYVIIDEQHRFGINQRKALARRANAEHTQNYAEKEIDDGFLYKDLSYTIRNILFDVKKELGGGHKEIVYQRAIEEELQRRKINYKREVRIQILYRTKSVGTYIPDFVIEDKVILELKALPFLGNTENKQLWTYLKGSDYKLALLANFGPRELTINRVIYEKARSLSASVPHSSAFNPHLLSMTATPIPRTLALTIYGDLDLTVIDQMPTGRKPIITEIVLPTKREETYEKIRAELKAGRQAYVICPRIDEPDPDKEMSVQAKSAIAEAKRLKDKIFPEYEIGVLHSKMKPKEKDDVMKDFSDNKTQILTATSVVEVGVNVPNATVIIIEGAERFGLAQLHQLRGRVIRSNHQAYCYVFTESSTVKTLARLKALKTAKNGFELAEEDLKLRGPGELSGSKQWGISDIGMEALKNIKMVELAREEAKKLVEKDDSLSNYPLLQKKLADRKNNEIHFE